MALSPPASPTPTLVADSPSGSWTSAWSSTSTLVEDHRPSVDCELIDAILAGDVLQARSLCLQGAPLPSSHLWALYNACLHGPDMIFSLLHNPSIDLNAASEEFSGDTILHFVLRTPASSFATNKMDVIAMLIHYGANPLQCDRLGDTALHYLAGDTRLSPWSAETEGFALLKCFLGADPLDEELRVACRMEMNTQNNYGNTPLVVATLYNNVDCVRLLLENGADIDVKGEFGRSALSFSLERGFGEVTKLLLLGGATLGDDTLFPKLSLSQGL